MEIIHLKCLLKPGAKEPTPRKRFKASTISMLFRDLKTDLKSRAVIVTFSHESNQFTLAA